MSWLARFDLKERLTEVIKRFPVVITFAVLTTITLMWMIDHDHGLLIKWAVSGFIGFLAMLNWTIYSEAYTLAKKKFWIGVILIGILLAIYYYFIPANYAEKMSCFWFFTIGLSLVLHILVSIIPFYKRYEQNNFVKYNVSLMIAWMEAALYGIILFSALSLALVAMDQLFGIDIKGIFYFKLFILIAGIFQTSFFLSEIPDDIYKISDPSPKSIFKVITSYVAIPIIFIYGIILYAYSMRIAFTDHQLVDWVLVMIVWYFTIGILSWLASFYFEGENDNFVMLTFRNYFFVGSIVPSILLLASCYKNYQNLGLNEEMYLSIALACFITVITIYQILPTKKDLRVIPAFLIIVSLVTFMGGPISVCTLPVVNAQHQIIKILKKNGLVIDGKLVIDETTALTDTNMVITNMIYMLDSRDALSFLKPYDQKNQLENDITAQKVIDLLKINTTYASGESSTYWNLEKNTREPIDIKGFDRLLPIKDWYNYDIKNDYLQIAQNGDLTLYINNKPLGKINIARRLYQSSLNHISEESVIIDTTFNQFIIKTVVTSAAGDWQDNVAGINHFQGYAFIKSLNNE